MFVCDRENQDSRARWDDRARRASGESADRPDLPEPRARSGRRVPWALQDRADPEVNPASKATPENRDNQDHKVSTNDFSLITSAGKTHTPDVSFPEVCERDEIIPRSAGIFKVGIKLVGK